MSAVYTKRLLVADLAAGSGLKVLVPAGVIWVVRNIIAICDTQASQMVGALYAPNPHIVAIAVQAANVTATYNAETRIVVQAGETLRAIAVAGGQWHFTVTGYEFAA
jgi:predicted secreted protein